MELERSLLIEMYRRMLRIREFENTAIDLFLHGELKGAATTYNGQEASAVGVCMALRPDDLIAGTHRSHGHNIAKGAESNRMMAELMGKATGYCRGRGGSMHIAAFDTGSLGALAVVGAGIPIAAGAALAFQTRGEDRVAVAFTGDGATNTGNFHETLNMAAIWNLPMLLVVENNQFAVSTRISESVRIADLSERARAYGVPGVRVDGFDVLAVYSAAAEAVRRARAGGGPTLLVTESYRFEGHYAGEPQVYRTRAEVQEYLKYDPIICFREDLLARGSASEAELAGIDAAMKQEMAEAVAYAKASPDPDPATVMEYNYA